jgi:hypothetical protein
MDEERHVVSFECSCSTDIAADQQNTYSHQQHRCLRHAYCQLPKLAISVQKNFRIGKFLGYNNNVGYSSNNTGF